MPARNFGEAVFKTPAKLVRVEIDPEKLYPQLDYANDTAPRVAILQEALGEATRLFGAQDYVKAEVGRREILGTASAAAGGAHHSGACAAGARTRRRGGKAIPAALDEALPTPVALAWANIGLGEISLKKGQAAEAAKRFNDAVRADAEYASSSERPGPDESKRKQRRTRCRLTARSALSSRNWIRQSSAARRPSWIRALFPVSW